MKLALPCPVLPVSAREQAARRMVISVDDVVPVAHGERAWRDGKVLSKEEFRSTYSELEYFEFTGADVFERDLTISELDVPRDPRQPLARPIAPIDVVAADVLAIGDRYARFLRYQLPSISMHDIKQVIQRACEDPNRGPYWMPISELRSPPKYAWETSVNAVLDSVPRGGAAGPPLAMHAVAVNDNSIHMGPRDGAFLPDGFLVEYPWASIVLSMQGEVRDAFATCGLRPIGVDDRHILFVSCGGPASDAGDFTEYAYVRCQATR